MSYYGSFASFGRAMKALKEQGVPNRLTPRAFESIMGPEGRRISTHFVAMGWVDSNDKPTSELIGLVKAFDGEGWRDTLSAAIKRAYSFVPEPWSELTKDSLHAAFNAHAPGRGDQLMAQAETFFLALMLECGMELPDRLYFRAERAHKDAVRRAKTTEEDPEDDRVEDRPAKKVAKGPIEAKSPTTSSRIDLILALSSVLGDGSLTDQERLAIGVAISVLAKRNAA